jgi:hypothetical protein
MREVEPHKTRRGLGGVAHEMMVIGPNEGDTQIAHRTLVYQLALNSTRARVTGRVVSSLGEQGAVRPAGASGARGRRFLFREMVVEAIRRPGAVAVAVAVAAGDQIWGRCRQHPACTSAWTIVGLVYLAGPALDEGESLQSLWARRAPPEGAANIRQDKYGFLWIAPEKFHETFCHDLDDKTESLVWALTQKPTAARCFEEKSGAPAWKVKPSWYHNDRLIPTETEKWMAERINARRTITLPTSHASLATYPDEIVKLIEEASSAVAGRN